jgi:hypothetical protein
MDENTLGLTSSEIEWLRTNSKDTEASKLIRQYQMVVVCPRDPGARGIFAAMLEEARSGFLAGAK